MKKLLIILILGIISTSSIYSQTYGIKAGLSVSNLATNDGDIEKDESRKGFTAGVFANYPIGIFAIQPELLFTQKGATYSDLGNGVQAKIDYIELPVSLQFNLLSPLYVYAGPQFSYLTSSRVEYEVTSNTDVIIDNDESNYNRFDVGGVIGVGLRINTAFIDARFSKGYIDFDKNRTFESAVFEARNLRNFNFQLTAGFGF